MNNGPLTQHACPNCGSPRSKVVNVWRAQHLIRRRRECLGCGARYNTSQVHTPEEVDPGPLNSQNSNYLHCHVKI